LIKIKADIANPAGCRQHVLFCPKPHKTFMPPLWRRRSFRLEFLWPLLHMYLSGSRIAARQNTLSCGGVIMAKNIQTEQGASPYSALPCVLLLLAAGLFVKIGVAAQLVHYLH
jgi:hypothetical protein